MATAETVLTVYSDAGMCQEIRALESWMSSKVSCPVWGEGIGKVLPKRGSNSPVSYATALRDLDGRAGSDLRPFRCKSFGSGSHWQRVHKG